ncbi:MAG: PTS sugar transporter subunit IIA [Acidobacteria bacterium]|jgi:two-component system sensor histidine kinase KdpD|nr:PTS sugar transporter subunit IIA [Acidobacteriota bacterium]
MSQDKVNKFLHLIQRSARGRLKVYLGYCAGVGKTYRMLQEGHALTNDGIDVVVGYVETHGRADIVRLLQGFEIVPRRTREYKGMQMEEMDLDAVLARKPAVALIDELAHNNVPESPNSKRYQDVQEILAAGIHVITTLNVQHLESLYDTVEKLVGVKVRERLPDTVITDADQIVNVDLTPEDLRKRLAEGKIYQEDKIRTALENFFTQSHLENLRELTLRELAAQIDAHRKDQENEESAAMPDQIMVCLSSRGPNSDLLLRYASRFAGRLNKNWYALYVQTAAEDPLHINIQTQETLSRTLTLAKQLGAIVFTYKGDDLASTIMRFAREYRIGHIIIGTPSRTSLLQKLQLKKTLSERLIREARGVNIVVVDTQSRRSPEGGAEADRMAAGAGKKPDISDFLTQNRILIWEGQALKEEVLRGLARAAYAADADFQEIYDRLLLREKESSTFFNEGVAFPHLRLEDESLPKIALGIIPAGIADAATVEPVRLVFLIVTSLRQSDIQAKLLAAASRIAGNQRLVGALLAAQFPETASREIEQWEKQGTSPDGK